MDKYTQPDFKSIAFMTIDVQHDILDGQPFEITGTSAILPRIRSLLHTFRKVNRPIIHIVRLYKPDGSNVDLCRRSLIEGGAKLFCPGTEGCELPNELLPDPDLKLDTELLLNGGIQQLDANEVVIYKPRWGAFYNTPLDGYLNKSKITTLAFTGANYPNCPRASIYEASERDLKIIIVEDAMSKFNGRDKNEMENIGVTFLKANELQNLINSK